MEQTVFEMNALPSPKWAEKYTDYLVKTFNCSYLDAICAVGELQKLMREGKRKEEKTCDNCKFKNDYPKCYKDGNEACDDWGLNKINYGKQDRKY